MLEYFEVVNMVYFFYEKYIYY